MGEGVVSVPRSVFLGSGVGAEFLPDMGELFRIHEVAVCHHRAQSHEAASKKTAVGSSARFQAA